MSQQIDLVRAFIEAFNANDPDRIMSFFQPDAVYHNIPMDPVQGTEAIRGRRARRTLQCARASDTASRVRQQFFQIRYLQFPVDIPTLGEHAAGLDERGARADAQISYIDSVAGNGDLPLSLQGLAA